MIAVGDNLRFAMIFGISIIFTASVVCRGLMFSKKTEGLEKVWVIIKSWWVIALIFGLALLTGPTGVYSLFLALSILTAWEYLKVSSVQRKQLVFVFVVLSTLAQYFALVTHEKELFFVLVPIMGIWVLPAAILSCRQVSEIPVVFSVTLGLMLTSYYLSHIPALLYFNTKMWTSMDQAMMAVLFLFMLTELNDVFQFLSGKMFGRRKPFPHISPNKTEAGFIGGFCATSLVGGLIAQSWFGLSIGHAVLLGGLISITGMCGDLFFSAVKRNIGIKDFSDVLPGHGGVIDRLDSLILTAPIFFHMMNYLKS